MNTALICKSWLLYIPGELKDESSKDIHKRSYLHYIKEHLPMVSAKCWATKWLFNRVLSRRSYTVREYMAGVGIQSTLIRGTYRICHHLAGDIDETCIQNLQEVKDRFPPGTKFLAPEFVLENANRSLLEKDNSDIKLLDFPNSSILTVTTKWKKGFSNLFSTHPSMVVWTDTSISYPITIHGEKYSKILDYKLKSQEDYIYLYSRWLYKNYKYSITKAAVRGKNAVYFCAIPGKTSTEIKYFPLDRYGEDGFVFVSRADAKWKG